MNYVVLAIYALYRCRMVFRSVAYLERDVVHVCLAREKMEIYDREVFFVCRLRVISVADI